MCIILFFSKFEGKLFRSPTFSSVSNYKGKDLGHIFGRSVFLDSGRSQ